MAKHILLVEDNSDDETLAVRALNNANIDAEIVVVRDGAAALDYLFATGEHSGRDVGDLPAMVLLDLKLPKVDGLEVLKRLSEVERIKSVPIVVFSSSADSSDIARSYKNGARSYVKKPVESDDFVRTTQQMASYWLSVNEPSP